MYDAIYYGGAVMYDAIVVIIACVFLAVIIWDRLVIRELEIKLIYERKLIEALADDLLNVYVSNDHNYAMAVAKKWVGERGELTRF